MNIHLNHHIAMRTAVESEVAKGGSRQNVFDIHFRLASRGPSGGRQPNFDFCEFTKSEEEERRFATVVAGFPNYGALSQEPIKRPNKSPEPTRCAVTPRAIGPYIESEAWNCLPTPARVVPAQRVAHL